MRCGQWSRPRRPRGTLGATTLRSDHGLGAVDPGRRRPYAKARARGRWDSPDAGAVPRGVVASIVSLSHSAWRRVRWRVATASTRAGRYASWTSCPPRAPAVLLAPVGFDCQEVRKLGQHY